jgi:hypothetical protein
MPSVEAKADERSPLFLILTAFPCCQDATIIPAKRAKASMEWLGDLMYTAEFTCKGNELKMPGILGSGFTLDHAC